MEKMDSKSKIETVPPKLRELTYVLQEAYSPSQIN